MFYLLNSYPKYIDDLFICKNQYCRPIKINNRKHLWAKTIYKKRPFLSNSGTHCNIEIAKTNLKHR